MTPLLYILVYLAIGIVISIHGMRTKWLPANKANVGLCVFTWIVFVIYLSIDWCIDSLVKFGKGKDV